MLKYTFWLIRRALFTVLSFYYLYVYTQNCVNGRNGRGKMHPYTAKHTFEILACEVEYLGVRTEEVSCKRNDQVDGLRELFRHQEIGGGERRTEKHPSDDKAWPLEDDGRKRTVLTSAGTTGIGRA